MYYTISRLNYYIQKTPRIAFKNKYIGGEYFNI